MPTVLVTSKGAVKATLSSNRGGITTQDLMDAIHTVYKSVYVTGQRMSAKTFLAAAPSAPPTPAIAVGTAGSGSGSGDTTATAPPM